MWVLAAEFVARRWYREAPASSSLIVVMLAVFVMTAVQSRSVTGNLTASGLADLLILWLPPMLGSWLGEYRALTVAFLHIGPGHLLMNAILLYLLGRELETYLGWRQFLALFAFGAVGSSAFILGMSPDAATAGASGALYALMAVFIGLSVRRGADLRAPVAFLVFNLVYTLMTPGVSLWGHVGGAVVGGLITYPLMKTERAGVRWMVLGVSLALALIAVYLLVWKFSTSGEWQMYR